MKYLAIVVALLVGSVSAQAQTVPPGQAYYIVLHPAGPKGPTLTMGPWNNLLACRDVLGSELYGHNFSCHLTGKPADCAPILGNGLAYPRDYKWVSKGDVRVPPERQIAPQDCTLLDKASQPHQYGWVGKFYNYAPGTHDLDGTGDVWPVNPANRKKYRDLEAQGKGVIPRGSFNSQCPGYPHSFVGSGVGQPDFACY